MAFHLAKNAICKKGFAVDQMAIVKALHSKQPRGWQVKAFDQVCRLYKTKNVCVVESVTGGGKTFFASRLAAYLCAEGDIEEVVIIAPSTPIKQNWAGTMESFSITCISSNYGTSGVDSFAVTYIGAMNELVMEKVCQKKKRLLIVDEFHHAERDAPWGLAVDEIAKRSNKILMLTGTPWRSEGEIALLKDNGYYQDGQVVPDFRYTYRQDLDEDSKNRATVYVHFSFVDSKAENQETKEVVELKIDGEDWTKVADENDKRPLGIHVGIKDQRLSNNLMARTMLALGISKLEVAKHETKGRAIGLVVARNIREARFIESYLTEVHDQRAEVIASDDDRAAERLIQIRKATRSDSPDWIVSVGMVSEGVDIPQIKVIVYLSAIMTLLYLVQVIGRCMRRINISKNSIAQYIDQKPSQSPGYVVMPAHPFLVWVASKFEEDKQYSLRGKPPITSKTPLLDPPPPSSSDWQNSGGQATGEVFGGRPHDVTLVKMLELLSSDEQAKQICNDDFRGAVREWMRSGNQSYAYKQLKDLCVQFSIELDDAVPEKTITTDSEITMLRREARRLTTIIRFNHEDYRTTPKSEDTEVYAKIRKKINLATGISKFEKCTIEQMKAWIDYAQKMAGI